MIVISNTTDITPRGLEINGGNRVIQFFICIPCCVGLVVTCLLWGDKQVGVILAIVVAPLVLLLMFTKKTIISERYKVVVDQWCLLTIPVRWWLTRYEEPPGVSISEKPCTTDGGVVIAKVYEVTINLSDGRRLSAQVFPDKDSAILLAEVIDGYLLGHVPEGKT